ncbi:hypothetical protein ScPMuIL_015484 [Solemya velum]
MTPRMYKICCGILLIWVNVEAFTNYKGLVSVSYDCGSREASNATVSVKADHPVRVLALCKGRGDVGVDVEPQDRVTYVLQAKYDGDESVECLFQQVPHTYLYTLELRIGYRDFNLGPAVEGYFSRYTITCTFDNIVSSESSNTEVERQSELANVVNDQHNMGGYADLNVMLDIVDQDNNPLSWMSLDGMVRLHAIITTIGSHDSIRALSCQVTNSEVTVPILIAGCGTGSLFSDKEGFITAGNNVFSPFFEPFRLQGNPHEIQFNCDFTLCASSCDGDSCSSAPRGKRAVYETRPGTIIRTQSTVGLFQRRKKNILLEKLLEKRCACHPPEIDCRC